MTAAGPTLINTDFRKAIERNKDNTLLLIEVLAVSAAVVGYVFGWGLAVIRDIWAMPPAALSRLDVAWILRDLFTVPPRSEALIGAGTMLAASIVWGVVMLYAGAHILSSFARTRAANPEKASEQLFIDVVKEMALAAGLPAPHALVIDTPALNAFAIGSSPEHAMITVTSGLLRVCSREELQGVVAHEMGHIADYDMRYATLVAAAASTVVLVCHLLWGARGTSMWRGGGTAATRAGLTLAVLIVMLAVSIVAPLAARLVQFAISRQREYLADATSVKLTRDPAGLIHALQRLEQGNTDLAHAGSPLLALCIAAPKSEVPGDLLASHPPIADRIARLRNLGEIAAPAIAASSG
jgi:heat shock protein HtpX